ncbi:MAG: response regulator transcription factor [Alkalilacustris sp.]
MTTSIEAFARLCSEKDPAARWQVACNVLGSFGGQWITSASAPGDNLHALSLRTSVPSALMSDYIGEGLPRRDLWLQHCSTSTDIDAVALGRAEHRSIVLDPSLRDILAGYGVRYVVLIPAGTAARTEGLVVYATSRDQAQRLAQVATGFDLQVIAALMSADRMTDGASPSDGARYRFGTTLTPREQEALLWLATGLRSVEIAHRMGIETVTANLHLQGARRKLGARTREQALAIALRDGHITP